MSEEYERQDSGALRRKSKMGKKQKTDEQKKAEKQERTRDHLKGLIEGGLSLTKVDSTPPMYEFTLGKQEKVVRVNLKQFVSRSVVNREMFGAWDFYPLDEAEIGAKEWRGVTEKWVQSEDMRVIDAKGISLSHQIIMSTNRYFDHFSEGSSWEDLNSGKHIIKTHKGVDGIEKDYYCFKENPLYKWLRRDLGFPVNAVSVDVALRQVSLLRGAESFPIRIGNPSKLGRAWELPTDQFDSYVKGEGEIASDEEGDKSTPFEFPFEHNNIIKEDEKPISSFIEEVDR